MRDPLRRALRVLLPVLVLGAGIAIALAMIAAREEVPFVTPPRTIPVVRVVEATPATWQARVRATGTVRPATQSDIVAEVGGRVIEIGPSLADGAFFSAGEVLLRLDARDHELALAEAQAAVARAELALELEQAESEAARREWQSTQRPGDPPPLVLREPQLADARAALEAAQARVEAAQRDVDRSAVRAPYDGRVLEKLVDLGRFVARGTLLARVYATDAMEVRLPVPDSDLAFLDLDLRRIAGGDAATTERPRVTLTAEFAGRPRTWHGRIVRTEGALDPRTRMVHLVARVADPFVVEGPTDAPLLVNQFVVATILGKEFQDVVVVPRAALRGENRVLVVDEHHRLHAREVEVLARHRDQVVLRSGLDRGDLVCITPLEVVVDGMEVQIAEPPTPADSTPADTTPENGR